MTLPAVQKQPDIPTGKDPCEVLFILDRSGSMAGHEADVMGGFNTFIDTLRKTPDMPPTLVSVTRFDEEIETFWRNKPLADVPMLTTYEYHPRGSTALNDAVGKTLSAKESTQDDATRYMCIIHTDGYENASHEWTAEQVSRLIGRLTNKGNWSFAFYGADHDAWANAQKYGVPMAATMSYDSANTKPTYAASSRVASVQARSSHRSTKNFGDATKQVAAKPDMTDAEIEKVLELGSGE